MYFLGNPNNIRLGAELQSAMRNNNFSLKDIANPANLIKLMESNPKLAEQIRQVESLVGQHMEAAEGIGIKRPKPPTSKSEALGRKAGEGLKNLRALGTQTVYEGSKKIDDASREDSNKPYKWRQD